MLPSLQVNVLMLSKTSRACLSSAKLKVMKVKSRHRSRIEDERPEPGGVGLNVQNATIGKAIQVSRGLCFEVF